MTVAVISGTKDFQQVFRKAKTSSSGPAGRSAKTQTESACDMMTKARKMIEKDNSEQS